MTPTHTEYTDAAKTKYVIGRYPDFGLISTSSGEHNNNTNKFDTQAYKV